MLHVSLGRQPLRSDVLAGRTSTQLYYVKRQEHLHKTFSFLSNLFMFNFKGGQRWMGPATSNCLRGAFQLRADRVPTQVHRLQKRAGQGKERQDVKVRLFEGWVDDSNLWFVDCLLTFE